jgi:hypothetical protein
VITDRRPGLYRYDELDRLGISVDLVDSDYARLRTALEAEARSGERRHNALAERAAYSFDASIDPLLAFLSRAQHHYHAKSATERRKAIPARRDAQAAVLSDRSNWRRLPNRVRVVAGRARRRTRQRMVVRRLQT